MRSLRTFPNTTLRERAAEKRNGELFSGYRHSLSQTFATPCLDGHNRREKRNKKPRAQKPRIASTEGLHDPQAGALGGAITSDSGRVFVAPGAGTVARNREGGGAASPKWELHSSDRPCFWVPWFPVGGGVLGSLGRPCADLSSPSMGPLPHKASGREGVNASVVFSLVVQPAWVLHCVAPSRHCFCCSSRRSNGDGPGPDHSDCGGRRGRHGQPHLVLAPLLSSSAATLGRISV